MAVTGGGPYMVAVIEGGGEITEFKKEKDRDVCVWPYWRMEVIEVDAIEGFYCILNQNKTKSNAR